MTVMGTDALGQPFKERTSALVINCHGCKYQSKHYVLKNTVVFFEVAHPDATKPARRIRAKVVWVQRPRTVQELFQVAAQLEIPGNVWGVAFPPEDWFPYPEESGNGKMLPATGETSPANGMMPPPTVSTPGPSEKVRVMPIPPAAAVETTAAVARQVSQLVADAKAQLQQAVRDVAASAVTAETGQLLREVEAQLRAAAKKHVESVATQYLEGAVERSIRKIDEARQTTSAAMRQQWMAEFERDLAEAGRKLGDRLQQSGEGLRQTFSQQLMTATEEAGARLAQIEERMNELRSEIAAGAAATEARVAALRSEMRQAASGASAEYREMLDQHAVEASARLRELEAAAAKLNEELAGAVQTEVPRLRAAWRESLENDLAAAGTEWNALVAASVSTAAENLTARLSEIARVAEVNTGESITARAAVIRQAFDQAAADANSVLLAVRTDLEAELLRVGESFQSLQGAAIRVDDLAGHVERMTTQAGEELERQFHELLASHGAQLQQRAEQQMAALGHTAGAHSAEMAAQIEAHIEQMGERVDAHVAEMKRRSAGVIAEMAERLQPSFDAAGEQSVARYVNELDQQFTPRLESAQQTVAELAASQQRAEQSLADYRERLHRVADEYLRNSEQQMRDTLAHMQKEFSAASDAALQTYLKELDEKSTDAKHLTFEEMYKSAEWYQKKAHAAMQASLEKTVESSVGTLRERAAEISRMFALELDHYTRSYTEHTQGLLDEAAKEVLTKSRGEMEQAGQTARASFGDEVHRIADEKLRNFAEGSSGVRDELTSQLDAHSEKVRGRWVEFVGKSFTELQDRVMSQINDSLAQAHREFQAGLLPVLESWRADREAQQREWMATLAQASNDAVEQYRQRLGNASNTWMVTSVTTLNQHSHAVMEALTKTAEQRLRTSCSQVLSGLAETFRQQVLAISSELSAAPPPPEDQRS